MTLRRFNDGSETRPRRPPARAGAASWHRSQEQICTAITSLGVEPPEIDLWALGEQAGTVVETPPTS